MSVLNQQTCSNSILIFYNEATVLTLFFKHVVCECELHW